MEISKPDLLLVVPIYNEAGILQNRLNQLYTYLKSTKVDFRLVLSVDDSGDESVKISRDFAASQENVDLLVHNRKLGRGFAVREAWRLHLAKYYAFIDADLSTGTDVISRSLEVAEKESYDVITGSRYVVGATVSRPPLRKSISRAYNLILRLVFNEQLRDHQCGFKLISEDVKDELLSLTSTSSWFWDTELLIVATSKHLKLKEIPVHWKEEKNRKTSFTRLITDIWLHGTGIIKLLDTVNALKTRQTIYVSSEKETKLAEQAEEQMIKT